MGRPKANRIIVPTELLAAFIESELAPALQREAAFSTAAVSGKKKRATTEWVGRLTTTRSHADATNHGTNQYDGNGWRTLLTLRCETYGMTQQAAQRRLYSITRREFRTTDHALADIFCLAAGVHICDTDLPAIPATIGAAIEMIETEAWIEGRRPARATVQAQARALYEDGQKAITDATIYVPHDTRATARGEKPKWIPFTPLAELAQAA